jgi:hypothetical protein
MFIEVYKIPMTMWTEDAIKSAIPENRKLINLYRIKDVDYSTRCEGRAEIEYVDGNRATVVGSYDEIVERIAQAVKTGKIQRVS